MASKTTPTTKYPTKEEILQNKPTLRTEDIRFVQEWKRTTWKTACSLPKSFQKKAKNRAIIELLLGLATLHKKKVNIYIIPKLKGGIYFPNKKLIAISDKPSVITGLHELAHRLFGKNEFKACAWSVHVFKRCFPKAFNKLKWYGHKLKKKKLKKAAKKKKK